MAKQLTKRFHWMRGSIADAFGLTENFVEEAIVNNEQNKQKLNLFLDSQGPPKLLVYYQTPDTGSENDQSIIDAQLFLTYGDTQRIKDKGVWFMRNLPEGKKKVNLNQFSNEEVLFGQITPNPVRCLSYMLQFIYDPLMNSQKSTDWGQAEQDPKKQFLHFTEKFKREVSQAIKLMEPGKQHFKLDPEELNRYKTSSESERIQYFEAKFQNWIKLIDRFLNTEVQPKNEGPDPGPKTELQFWRQRMQTITNWSEQLKSKDFNMVKTNLAKYKQNQGKKQGQQNINKLMLNFQRLDLALTDKLNEAKDNVKYLSTLEKFIEPLYTGTPQQIIQTLPALMNAIKMIHTIARFYNTSDKMTGLFIKITNQMIKNCKEKIIPVGTKPEDVWKRDPVQVIEVLGSCIKLNREYKQAYKATKQKVADMPKGKTFDFSQTQIFNKFDQFVKRLQKLIQVFTNIQQFDALAKLNLEKMDIIINKFNEIRDKFKQKRKADLLDLSNSTFDKEYVSFNISISQLDTELQAFIDDNFSKSKSIEHSINLLKKFESTIKRDALKHNLTSKYNTILTNYASQLEAIQRVFNDQKSDPPIVRNMPDNAGKIIWSKHLYQKIAGPITKFPQNVIHSSQIKKYYGNYNTLGKMLTINQMWYYDLWVKEIERSKAALQATLIVRHQTQKKLYVNFDVDIMQLIRQAKCLDRQGIPIPESARIILLQEQKFKMYYNELLYVLKQYERIVTKIKPICKNVLSPHIADMELKLHPGMSTLTWTSMNIDSYLNHVHQGLNKLEQLIINVNDIIQNRIENNLKSISKVSLVSLPHDNITFTLENFVSQQEQFINDRKSYLTSKNLQVERAVDDLLLTIISYNLDPRIDAVKAEETKKIKRYYFWYLYNALLHATQNSLNSMKYRVCGNKVGSNNKLNPFFEVDVQLSGSQVRLNPSLEQIQKAINKAATAVLRCSKTLYNWDQHSTEQDKKQSLYEMIGQDKQIVKVILLLTGSIQGTKNKINEFISKFNKFEWLWKKNISKSITEFSKGSEKPQLTTYEAEFKKFFVTETEIDKIQSSFVIGAMQLKTQSLVIGLKQYTKQWKNQYAEDLHKKARAQLYKLSDYIKELTEKLNKTVVKDIDSLGVVMEKLEEIRALQAVIDISFNPVTQMYALLDANLPGGITDRDQVDARSMLKTEWQALVDQSQKIGKNLSIQQTKYLKKLKQNVKDLVKDVADFRADYQKNGPMVQGIEPKEAIQKLKRYEQQYEVRQQQYKINKKGQELFGLQCQKYPALEKTKSELTNLKKLYNLYSEVINSINSFQQLLWTQVSVEKLAAMQESAKKFGDMCTALPKDLKGWQAYKQLKVSIQNLKQILPVIQILKKDAVKDRHWQALNQKTEYRIPYDQLQIFIVQDLTKAKVLDLIEEIEQIGQSAEKQKKIQNDLDIIDGQWQKKQFDFASWGKRENAALAGLCVQQITQRLEQDQMTLSSINAQRHVTPFKKKVEEMIRVFSDTSETLDLWIKVQKLWTSLEPVFTGGDIAKQMPLQAKQFAGIDKTWMKCMQKSFETKKVIQSCQQDLLKDNLPDMMKKLQECQQMLQAYLQGKRKLFPRFYFVSNPALLKILSQGSDPTTIQEDFEKLFDAITKVQFGRSDKKGTNQKTITTIVQEVGGKQAVTLLTPVKCQGLIESWLKVLEKQMQQTMRQHCRNASIQVMNMDLISFVKSTLSQVSLMGIQLIWTQKITQALEKGQKQNKGALQAKKKEIQKMLVDLTNLCLQPIETSLERTKIQTLVTVHVHQRDLANEMKCQNINDFDWQKQTRLYWKTQQDTCIISITDWQQGYSYEFLGAKERLCITPLTDRCYITLAQAMSMYYGGAPAGPAGTGKTETVKDLGRGLGIFVVVTNCSDQHRYRDMAKIFKGLVQSGLWGCFDQFNRIELEVLSVVAMQVQAIGSAKKQHLTQFMFPEQAYPIGIVQSVGYFITMNPGYAGRQQLPQNLKVLFRGVTMMVPDRQIIIMVKLASVGYEFIGGLSKKFNILYKLCEQQLSKQRHYDFGLRNILSVLRTAGNTKRKQTKPQLISTPQKKQFFEEFLLMRSLRNMNMSKLVFEDISLFEGLLKDIFPRQNAAEKVDHAQVQSRIPVFVKAKPQLVNTPSFANKIIQVYETAQVRHGFMLLGDSASGKSTILTLLTEILSDIPGRNQYRIVKLNPKAFTEKEMFGVKSQISDDWIPGVFSTLWQKCNARNSKFNIWITCDGPVDTIWIESLNTVLDDNKILTLANGERIPMSDQCKLAFQVENLNNASPATVSRCGQVYVSPSDLGYSIIYEGWCQLRAMERSQQEANILKKLLKKYFDDWKIIQHLEKLKNTPVMDVTTPLKVINTLSLLNGLLKPLAAGSKLSDADYDKVVTYSISWAVGGLYQAAERFMFHDYLQSKGAPLPTNKKESETIFDYYVHIQDNTAQYRIISPQQWKPSAQKGFKFSQLLLPTLDSWRAQFLIDSVLQQPKPIHSNSAFLQNGVLLLGGSGTAKTSSVQMWSAKFDSAVRLFKRINFSSATSPGLFQASIEQQCDNKMGKDYGPPQNKKLAVFIDDMSMPFVNKWGDQVTLQIVRQLIEQGGFYWLDKAQRGNFKNIRNLSFIGAMNHPGGGRNDIPNRLKRQFFIFNMILPLSIEGIYGPIVKFQFRLSAKNSGLSDEVKKVIENLTTATIKLWEFVKKSMLPTPAKFHYLFNMRQLARTFKGLLQIKRQTIMKTGRVRDFRPELFLVGLWRHECQRVFCDKLVNNKDKDIVLNTIHDISISSFNMDTNEINEKFGRGKQFLFADFMDPDKRDQEGNIEKYGQRNYEACNDIEMLRNRVYDCMNQFNMQPKNTKKLELVFFNDALKHLIKITRIIAQPRSSALLVGVGGSGKQSLTRLASTIERMEYKQIELIKGYAEKDLKEDIKKYFEITGRFGKNCCFILTDSEIKKEEFLQFINMILSTGQIPGLLAKDQRETFLGDARNDYVKQFKGADPQPNELYNYFIDRIRDNLHVVLCFSPVGQKFRDRFIKFPALFNECTIDWFLPWPQEALISVAQSFIKNFKQLDTTNQIKGHLMKHMGNVHIMVTDICGTYYAKMRRQVYFTPKSYLGYLAAYKKLYLVKYRQLDQQQSNFTIGVNKINEAAQTISIMKKQLSLEELKLKEASDKTQAMLKQLEVQQKEAQKIEATVNEITIKCQKEASDIAAQKEEAERQLAAAIPAQQRAQAAVDSLDAASVNEMKANKKPQQILKLTLDAIAIYFNLKLAPIQMVPDLQVARGININFWKNSFEESGKFILGPNFDFLKNLKGYDKDSINPQTIQLLEPMLQTGTQWFNETNTGKVSKAIQAICKWLFAVYQYYQKSQIVKPRRIKLALQEANLGIAMQKLEKSREQLRVIKEKLAQLNENSQKQMDIKNELQQQALKTKKKINTAQTLINSLSGQRARWKQGASQISNEKKRLIGNVSLATAFISYCGPFNADFRQILAVQKFTQDMKNKDIPHYASLAYQLTNFLVDEATVGQWNLQGLPKDNLSVQNGIMVTNSDRYPLLVDPQGQGQSWILRKYADEMEKGRSLTNLNNPKFKDWFLKFCLQNGKTLVIEGIQNQVDPLLDPVLEKQVVWKKTRGLIKIGGADMDFDKKFKMFLTCRLPNPSFSPQLSAKTTIIDFAVTQSGLEQQLLGRVISHQQKALEDSLNTLLNDVNANKKALQKLDRDLLQRLTQSKGNLLDDTSLMQVLNNTKTQAKQVSVKLEDAEIKTKQINEKRQQYRPVAIRGSALYFTLIQLFLVNWMYNSSLQQFLELFNWSLAQKSPQANSPQKRVQFIIKVMTKHVHKYVNRGLFEKDKITFMLMICFKLLITAKKLTSNDVGAFLKAGAGQDIKTAKQKPQGNQFNFIDQKAWLNVIAYSKHQFGQSPVPNFKQLPELISKNQPGWLQFFQRNDPENYPIPDLSERLSQQKQQMRAFMEMYLLRSVRQDRTLVAASKFISSILGTEYTDPISYPIQDIWAQESKYYVPILFLLSAGADPTSSIDQFARKKKKITEKVSMGQGQQQPAKKAIKNSLQTGNWVILQNCQLGLKYMEEIEQMLISFNNPQTAKPNEEFRLWITCQPHNRFPLGLLQKVIKVTNQPPKGLKAGLYKTFTTLINQQFLQKVDNPNWKNLIFTVCYLHSLVIERRKFGSLGWCVPYQFNNSDLQASLCFVEKYLNNLANLAPVGNQMHQINMTVIKFMVCEVLYGGRITDDLDRQLFATYGDQFLKDGILNVNEYVFHGNDSKDKNAFKYKMPANPALQLSKYLEYIGTVPGNDSPQVFGLDPNADLTFRLKQSVQMITTIMQTRPKQASGGSGKTLQQQVREKSLDLLSKLPNEYNENQVKQLIRKLQGPKTLGASGYAVPLNIFLSQEIVRMQKVITIVKKTLIDVGDAIDGQIIMTPEILQSINAIFDARVPSQWVYDPTGAQISWIIPTLAKWFNDLIQRNKQLFEWMKGSRPNTFWLGGFFNPQGFLTAMKQQVTRMHKTGKPIAGGQFQQPWSLDDVVYSATVRQRDQEAIKEGNFKEAEGVFIRQLILEACRWHKNTLQTSKPREIFSPLPILHVTALNKKKATDDKSVYNCPVYKYAKRTDKYLIFRVNLNSDSEPPAKWKLKGVALLCAKD